MTQHPVACDGANASALPTVRRLRHAIRQRFIVRFLLSALAVCFCLGSVAQQEPILSLTQSVQLPQASIWGGVSYNGVNISVSTTFSQDRPHLFLRKLDGELRQIGPLVQLTLDSDPEALKHITDHKHLFLNGFHFITFSVAGDSDLYIFKVDRDGRRVGSIVPVVENTANRTNDMMFCTDGDLLYVAYFKPTEHSIVHIFDQNLRQVRPPLVTSPQLPHNNLGGMAYHEGKFYMFTGDKAGPNSNLILTIWNRDWTPAQRERRILIPAPADGGYFFATGIAFDKATGRCYVGFHHVRNSDPDRSTHLDLAVFDESFNLLEHRHGAAGFRPHLLLMDRFLYMVYDRSGVFIDRYHIRGQPVANHSTLYFPCVIHNDLLMTGLAVVNPAEAAAHVTFAAYDNSGRLVEVPGGGNPCTIVIPARGQLACMVWELFGANYRTDGGWIMVSTDQPDTRGFFLVFDSRVETMDGAAGSGQPLTYFVFPVVESTEISLVNASSAQTAEVTIRLIDNQGRDLGDQVSLRIPPRERHSNRPRDQTIQAVSGASYGILSSTVGLIALERFGQPGTYESALSALDANGGARRLFAPQFVFGDGIRSSVTLINLDDDATTLSLSLVDDHGQAIGSEATLSLAARGCLVIEDLSLFGMEASAKVQGYLRAMSSATRITGTIQLADSSGGRFQTALPLVAEVYKEVLYPHIAQNESYFTGVAMVNANAQPVDVEVEVFSNAGQLAAAGASVIEGGGRVSRLLSELVPSMQLVSGGYFKVSADQPLAGFGVIGTSRLTALAAMTALPVQTAEFVGAAPAESYLKVNADSDFKPPKGGVAGGPGPAMFRLMVARSRNGLDFERTNRIVTDQGAVPDMVVDRDGTIYLYYTGWTVGREINKTVVAISRDNGESWTFKKLDIQRYEGESDLVDPDVLVFDDGTFRLYTTIGDKGSYPRTHYSDSSDGIHFERKGVAFDPGSQALDPSSVKIGDIYHLFAGGAGDPEANWHATSSDGAVYQFDRLMTFKFDGFGQMMANGLKVDGGYRFYCFGNNRKGGISSFFTTDGEVWTPDEGYRLTGDADSTLEDGLPTDPAIARLKDGSCLMVYSCGIKTAK